MIFVRCQFRGGKGHMTLAAHSLCDLFRFMRHYPEAQIVW